VESKTNFAWKKFTDEHSRRNADYKQTSWYLEKQKTKFNTAVINRKNNKH